MIDSIVATIHFINETVEPFCRDPDQEFAMSPGRDAFLGFIPDCGDTIGRDRMIGSIVYVDRDRTVQHQEVYAKLTPNFESFRRELYFSEAVAECIGPVLRHIPEYLTGRFVGAAESGGADVGLLVFVKLENFHPHDDYTAYLCERQLSLMAKTIGQLHAHSFRYVQLYGEADMLAKLPPIREYGLRAELRDILHRCRRALRPGPDSQWTHREASPLFARIETFFARTEGRLVSGNADCNPQPHRALCHRHYSRFSVLFQYRAGAPVDLRIVNWHAYGYTSLGVDLVLLLFVESNPYGRKQLFHRLVGHYHGALQGVYLDAHVPSYTAVLQEIKACLPIAFCVLAERIHTSGAGSIWNDNLVTNLYSELLDNEYYYFDSTPNEMRPIVARRTY